MSDPEDSIAPPGLSAFVNKIRARTPARLLAGRAGSSYRTETQIALRQAHAAARDAVQAEMDLAAAFGDSFIRQWQPLECRTQASSKREYLLRPDLGRHFDEASRNAIQQCCPRGADLQIAIGDGLSVPAVSAQVPTLLPLLQGGATARGLRLGRLLVIHRCRVAILNDIGELLSPRVVLVLIGERPGLATAESLSAYMAFQPTKHHTDADRNLISNIHNRGVQPPQAAARILNLAARMVQAQSSGYRLREELPTLAPNHHNLSP